MRASRISHSTAANGCVPGVVKKRLIDSASPGAVSFEIVGCGVGFIGLPPLLRGVGTLTGSCLSGRPCSREDRTEERRAARSILEGPPALGGLASQARPVAEFGPCGRCAEAALGHRVAQREHPARLEDARPHDGPGGAAEGGFRASATWAEFSDWARLGR